MPGTYSKILLHFAFSTKKREPLITSDVQSRLYPYIGGIIRKEQGSLYEIGGTADHVHMLIRWRTDEDVAALMRQVKSSSSSFIHDVFPELRGFAWQEGYGVFSVSHSQTERVRKYIADQEEHHRVRTFQSEFIRLLKAHDIEYDERYIWD